MIANSVIGVAGKILDKFVEDKDLKMKLEHELKRELHDANLAQIDVNKEQAKNPSLFVSGARPAIMWICALGLLMSFFIMPLAEWATAIWYPEMKLPDLNTGELMTLTLSLLGLGGLRSFEKSKGVARDNLKQ